MFDAAGNNGIAGMLTRSSRVVSCATEGSAPPREQLPFSTLARPRRPGPAFSTAGVPPTGCSCHDLGAENHEAGPGRAGDIPRRLAVYPGEPARHRPTSVQKPWHRRTAVGVSARILLLKEERARVRHRRLE
jgi:hypothetical protein